MKKSLFLSVLTLVSCHITFGSSFYRGKDGKMHFEGPPMVSDTSFGNSNSKAQAKKAAARKKAGKAKAFSAKATLISITGHNGQVGYYDQSTGTAIIAGQGVFTNVHTHNPTTTPMHLQFPHLHLTLFGHVPTKSITSVHQGKEGGTDMLELYGIPVTANHVATHNHMLGTTADSKTPSNLDHNHMLGTTSDSKTPKDLTHQHKLGTTGDSKAPADIMHVHNLPAGSEIMGQHNTLKNQPHPLLMEPGLPVSQ
ncbi:MAG: hypothetical protein CL947_01185 [Epsilonproteobacteria bacterium]|nr:hypothetical protein [Campylobacterota bacterium]|tara:strand:+ start:1440 stop:2198 length:759 start_codon:yes stop_codon:yes gene_type:complete